MKKILLLCLSLLFTGCAGLNYVTKHYSNIPVKIFYNDGKTYRIFDKPHDNRLMITPAIVDAMIGGLLEGFEVDASVPKPVFESAAQAYITRYNGQCSIIDGYKVINPQWEFRYKCQRNFNQKTAYPAKPKRKVKYGIGFSDLTPEQRTKYGRNNGAFIFNVLENTPAFDANIVIEDVLIGINGNNIKNAKQAKIELRKPTKSNFSIFTIIRKGVKKDIRIEFNK